MKNKRIFISGGAGVIGRVLVNMLLQEGAEVFVGDLKPCPTEWIGKVRYFHGDLNNITPTELAEFNPEIFFHLAATFERSDESLAFFEDNFHHNIKLSHHLMWCLKESKDLKKVLFASSYLVYDPYLYQFSQPNPPVELNESTFVYPRNLCGASKFYHELEIRFLDHFFKDRLTLVCARIFRVYGKGSKDIISRWVRAALKQEAISVYSSEGRFDYIFADDVAEGLIRLAKSSFSGIVNVGTGDARQVKDVLAVLQDHFPELKYEEIPSTIPFESSQADVRLFEKVTGWRAPYTIEMAIPKVIEYEKTQLETQSKETEYPALLITAISSKIPLIEAVRSAARKIGSFSTIHGSDCDQECIGQYGVDHFWNCPKLEDQTLEDTLAYCLDHHIKAIIPTRNADLVFYAKHRNAFEEEGIHVLVSPQETIERCLDKKLFAEYLEKHHFPVIPTSLLLDFEASSYAVKERYGAGSISLGMDLSRDHAMACGRSFEQPLYQPYIKGVEWSVDLYCSLEGKVMGCVARQRNLVRHGEAQVTTTASFPALEELCKEMARSLEIYGPAVFQIIEDDEGKFHVIECNPRFGGASTASLAVGLDPFYWFLLESMQQQIESYPFMRSSREIRQVRHPSDWILPWS